MSGADTPLVGSRDDAGEVMSLLDLLSSSAHEARSALAGNDLDLLEQILDERESIARRVESIFAAGSTELPDRPLAGGHSLDGGQDGVVEAVMEAVGRARNAEALLASTFESEMARIARELDQMESDQAVRSLYGSSPRKLQQINVVR